MSPLSARLSFACRVLVGGVLLATLAGCQILDTPTRLQDGPYVGLVGGASLEQFELPDGVDSDTGGVVGARAGYRFLGHRAAVEFAYEELLGMDLELDAPVVDIGEVTGRTLMAQIKGYLIDAPIQGYGLVGFGLADLEIDDDLGAGLEDSASEFTWKVGGGVELHQGDRLTLFAEGAWTQPEGDLSDFGYFTVLGGVNFRF